MSCHRTSCRPGLARVLLAAFLLSSSAASSRAQTPGSQTQVDTITASRELGPAVAGGGEADLSITISDSADPVNVGTPYFYTLEVTNAGPSTATSVTVIDTIPDIVLDPMSFISASGDGWSCSLATLTATCTRGSLAVGLAPPITVEVTGTGVEAIWTNHASVSSATPDPSPSDNEDTEETTIIRLADVSVTVTDSADPVLVGSVFEYTVEVFNAGPYAASNVIVSQTLPLGLTANLIASVGWLCAPQIGDQLFCGRASLAPGEVASYSLWTKAPLMPGTLTHVATVESNITDPATANNQASEDTAVVAETDLSIVKDDGVATAVPGGSTTYSIQVGNSDAALFSIDPASSLLRQIDPATGATLASVTISLAGETVTGGTGLATQPGTGALWALLELVGQAGSELVTLDPATGVATSIGDTGILFSGLAFNGSGTVLYGVSGDDATPSESLFTLSQVDASSTLVLGLGSGNTGETIASDGEYVLYHASGSGTPNVDEIFEEIDLNGLGVANVPLSGDDYNEATGLVYNPATDAFLLGDLAQMLHSVTKSGVVTGLGPMDHVSKGMAFAGGGLDAVGATVADAFPPELSCTWSCAPDGTGGSCTAGPVPGDILDTVDLPAGESVTYTAVCAIDPSAVGTVTNTATVTPPAGMTDLDPVNSSSIDVDTLTSMADLSITKDDGAATAIPGTDTIYTIGVANVGPSSAPAAVVTDAFPAACTTVTWTCSGAGGGSCPAAAGNGDLNASVGLPVGGSVTFLATCAISPTATGSLVNTASVVPGVGVTDPNAGNDSATDADTLEPSADLSITKDDGQTTAIPGSAVTYTIVASNAGPSDAPGSTLMDTFPAALQGVSWTCSASPGSSCPAAGVGDLAAPLDLAAGGSAIFLATGTIAPTFVGDLVNTASVASTAGVTDPNAANDRAADTTLVASPAALSATKEVMGDYREGGTILYTIVLSNAGPGAQLDNPGDELADELPPELILLSASADSGTALADLGTNTVTWNGSIPPLGTVTIWIDAQIAYGAGGPTIANQAELFYDADGNGTNEAMALSDDPDAGGPTLFRVLGLVGIPTLGGIGLLLLGLLIGASGLARMRRR